MQAWWDQLSASLRPGPERELWLNRPRTLELLNVLTASTELGAGSYGTVFGQRGCGIVVKLTFDPDGEQQGGLSIGARHRVGCQLLCKLGLHAATLISYRGQPGDLRAAVARTRTHFKRYGDDLDRWNGFSALVLERLDTDLQKFLGHPPPGLTSAVLCTRVLEPLLGHLRALNKLGWFFHDAKPSNILLDVNEQHVVSRVLLGDLDLGCLSRLPAHPEHGDALVAYVASVSPDALVAATAQLRGWDAGRFWAAWHLAIRHFIEGLGTDGGRYWRLYAVAELGLPERAILRELEREPASNFVGRDPDRLSVVLGLEHPGRTRELLVYLAGEAKQPARALCETLRLSGTRRLTLGVLRWLADRRRDPPGQSVRVVRWALGAKRCNQLLYTVVAARLAGLTGWPFSAARSFPF